MNPALAAEGRPNRPNQRLVDRFDVPGQATKTRRWRWIAGTILIAATLVLPAALGQTAAPATTPPAPGQAPKKDDPLGTWQLVTTVFEPSEKTHLLNPAPIIKVEGGTERAPGEFTGEVTVPAQYTIESFGSPWYDCVATAPKTRACDALDRTELTIRDPNTLSYHIVSHGAPSRSTSTSKSTTSSRCPTAAPRPHGMPAT